MDIRKKIRSLGKTKADRRDYLTTVLLLVLLLLSLMLYLYVTQSYQVNFLESLNTPEIDSLGD